VSAVQDRLSMRDVLPRGYQARIKFDAFLRSDAKTRAETYWLGLPTGMITIEEIREIEERPALPTSYVPPAPGGGGAGAPNQRAAEVSGGGGGAPDLDRRLQGRAGLEADMADAQFADDPKKPYGDVPYADPGYQADGKKRYPIDTEEHCRAAWSYINQSKNAAKYDADELSKIKGRIKAAGRKFGIDFEASSSEPHVQFDSAEVHAEFRVNAERRIITGLAVPWGEVAASGHQRYRFAPGSLTWADVSRVKVFRDHDHHEPIGRALALTNTAGGLEVTLKIARGSKGDEVLSLAEDGVLDGLSVGIKFDEPLQPDNDDPSVMFVHRAMLREVSVTALPSFDGARVTDVAASQSQKGAQQMGATTIEPAKAGTTPDGAEFDLTGYVKGLGDDIAESHKNLTAELSQSIGESVAAGLKVALEGLPGAENGPERVRAARFAVTREEPVYSMNGAGFSLVRDAWYAANARDGDALDRLRKYRAQTEDMAKLVIAHGAKFAAPGAQFATATRATDPEIIPPGYRPDLYQPQIAQQRPLVAAASNSSIPNATPFSLPIFTSAVAVTADHVEGTNPTDGTLNFGTVTVTPGGISGLLKLTRELVDASNPAIDAIALAAMRESYAQQTEVKMYTMLNGSAGVAGTITGDFVPSGAQASTVVAPATDAGSQTLLKHIRERLAKYPFYRFASPTVAVMGLNATTRLATANDTTGRALLPSVGATNATGLGNAVSQGWSIDGLSHLPAWAMTGTAAGDAQIIFLNSADVYAFESPTLTFRYEERSGPALVELALFGYFGAAVLRPRGLSGIRITLV
jgi:HK97 family phage prohead protease/HK97 family phage major capsid protein